MKDPTGHLEDWQYTHLKPWDAEIEEIYGRGGLDALMERCINAEPPEHSFKNIQEALIDRGHAIPLVNDAEEYAALAELEAILVEAIQEQARRNK